MIYNNYLWWQYEVQIYQFDLIKMQECLLSRGALRYLSGCWTLLAPGNNARWFCQERQNQRGISPFIALTLRPRTTDDRE
jgi:hypothetical protein